MPWGESHPRAKVTEADVLVMRAMYAKGGITMTALAKQYGLEKSTVRAIIRKETWRHV
jgi:DNA-binding MarR family transcriptional regulator